MECPAEKMQKDENYKRIMLVAAGSAMAASCEPCLNMVIPNLIEVGVPDTEIRRAVEIGQYVKDREADIMKEAADVLAGTSFLDKEIPEQCAQDEMETLKADKTSMLIALGAAVAGNCDSCLEHGCPGAERSRGHQRGDPRGSGDRSDREGKAGCHREGDRRQADR